MHYRDWTAQQVRDWLIEAAETATRLPGGYGPRRDGNSMPEIVREKWKDAAPNSTISRQPPSSHALSRMELVWSWVNSLEHEAERRLLYEWSEAKALGRGYLARIIENSAYSERTFRRAVNRVCKRIADEQNRKCEIRLVMPVDGVSVMGDAVTDFSVSSKTCAHTPSPRFVRSVDKLHHDIDDASIGKQLAAINRRRQNEARRKAERQARKRKAAEKVAA